MAGTHLLSGVAAGIALLSVAPITGDPFEQAAWVAAVGLCALVPDLDHPQSTLGRMLLPVSWLVAWISGGHRKATHSLLGVAVFAGLAQVAVATVGGPAWVPYAVAAGCAVHIAGDCLTRSGCPLLWPASTRFGLGLFKTGGLIERIVVAPVLTMAAVWLAASAVMANG